MRCDCEGVGGSQRGFGIVLKTTFHIIAWSLSSSSSSSLPILGGGSTTGERPQPLSASRSGGQLRGAETQVPPAELEHTDGEDSSDGSDGSLLF